MDNFNRFLKHKKIKLGVVSVSTILPILVIIFFEALHLEESALGTFDWIRYVIFAFIETWLILKIINYIKIIVDEEHAKDVYIKLNDEREAFVKQRATVLTLKLALYFSTVALLIFGFINQLVFYTIIVFLVLIFVSFMISSIYYRKKY